MNWTKTVFWPSPLGRIQVFDVEEGSQSDHVALSFEKRICVIPEVVSVAETASVIVGVWVVVAPVVMEPTGAVLANLIPVNVTCGSSIVDIP